eukprot:6175866-Pleurochrysis_carterae.AAC.2
MREVDSVNELKKQASIIKIDSSEMLARKRDIRRQHGYYPTVLAARLNTKAELFGKDISRRWKYRLTRAAVTGFGFRQAHVESVAFVPLMSVEVMFSNMKATCLRIRQALHGPKRAR